MFATAAAATAQQRTILDGVYTEAQAVRGRASYEINCRSCHFDTLTGGVIVDAARRVMPPRDGFSVNPGDLDELYSFVSEWMPADAPASLHAQTYVDIIAFLLQTSGAPAGTTELRPASDVLAAIRVVAKPRQQPRRGSLMRARRMTGPVAFLALMAMSASPTTQGGNAGTTGPAMALPPKLADYKKEAAASVHAMYDLAQQMVDSVFSFAEIGFQEFETQRYLTGILEREGFVIERGVAGIPTAWTARWGSGKPVIALGSDIDGIPQASQKPGVAYRSPIVEGAPGHGEGHNSGTPLNIVAAIAAKRIMEREKLTGTLMVWPGVAEELLATKAYYVRAGLFEDADVVLYNHVGTNLTTGWGESAGNGLVSVEYTFEGETAHSATAPWRGRSAMDAVELMNVGWNFRREHLRIQQRSHYVVTNGGDQPNVVPRNASVWYYFRETSYPGIKQMWEIGDKIAQGAAMMTDTTVKTRVLGSAWPSHMNKVLAETMYANIKAVGLPTWSEADLTLAKAVQRELKVPENGLATEIPELRGRQTIPDNEKRGGGSDDIGDISWNVPTVSLSFPANFQAGPGHNWANAIAMATPIAHKGVVAGAKVQALTILDVLMRPEVVAQAWEYFRDVQTKDVTYTPLIRTEDTPAIWLNEATMARYRSELRKHYYDPARYKTYLEQLGIEYPTIR